MRCLIDSETNGPHRRPELPKPEEPGSDARLMRGRPGYISDVEQRPEEEEPGYTGEPER